MPSRVDLSRLPRTDEHFVGRENELALLGDAWTSGKNLFSIVAWGGVGKTAPEGQASPAGDEDVLAATRRRLAILRKKKAYKGVNKEPEVLMEIEDLEKEIARLEGFESASVMSPRLADPRDAAYFRVEVNELADDPEDSEP